MITKSNPFLRSALLATALNVGVICPAWAADYHFGSTSQSFTIPMIDCARDLSADGNVDEANGALSIYWRGSSSDSSYLRFDLSSLQSGSGLDGPVSLNCVVNATWGGSVTGSQISTANGAWSATLGNTTPGFTAINGATNPSGNYSQGSTASWSIPAATFQSYIGNPSFFGLVLSGNSNSNAHFYTNATLTGSLLVGEIYVTGGTNWSSAIWDEPVKTLRISGSNTVTGGNVSLNAGTTLSLQDQTTLGSGAFPGSITNQGALAIATSANQSINGVISGAGSVSKSGAGTLTLSAANTYTGGTTVDSGILELSGSNSGTGRIRGPLTVNAGAEVRLTNDDGTGFGYNDARISALTINGATVSSGGALHIWNVTGGVILTGGTLSSNGGVSAVSAAQLEWGNTPLSSHASATTSTVNGRIHIRRDSAPMLRVDVADGAAATDLLLTAALTESGSGCGLVKSGAGTLKLGGAVNLTGCLTVNAGTLDLSTASLPAGVRINLLSGANFIPPTSGLPAMAALFVNGEKLAPGTWGAPGSVAAGLAQFESPTISGSTVMTVPDTGISNRERWKSLKYGIFSHYMWMGYPGGGVPDINGVYPQTVDEQADKFNATAYANDVAEAGAQYVVFTAWHANTRPMWPSSTMAKYGQAGGSPTSRDVIGDMIDAVKAKGIRVFLYTHPYQPVASPWEEFINELYAETMARYGSRIDGLWIDENTTNATQDSLVDYKRLMNTIKEGNPDLVTMQNGGQLYTNDTGGPEVANWWNFGWSESQYNYVNGPGIGAGTDDMLRTTVLEAAANFEGGGVHWSIDGIGLGGLKETTRIFALGRYLAPIRPSVCETTPSTSFPPPYKNGRTITYDTVDWVATTSMDDTKEFIHVLKPQSGNTLTLPAAVDGKVFSSATLMASLEPGGGTQQYLGLPMAMLQTPRGIQLTLPSGVSWSSLDTVIQLDVASKGGAGMVNNTSTAITYNGASWTYQNHRGAGEYNDDAHIATANGDSFTFTFSGTDVEYIATRAADRGPVDIYIDEVFQATINLSTGTPTGSRQVAFRKSGLARGTHTLRAVKIGGTSMDADAFRVSDLVNDSDPEMAGAFLTTTEYGPGAAGHYGWPNSEWQNGNNVVRWITPHVNFYGGNEPLNDPLNNEPVSDYFEFTFTGTGVRIPLGSAFSYAYFYMKVDGVFHSNVAVSDRQLSYFDVQGLPPGIHTVRGITWKSTFDPSQPGFNGFTVTRPDLWNTASGRGLGEIGDDVHYTDINPARLVWNFNGSGVDVITTRDSDARMAWFSVAGMGRHVGARRNNYSAARQTGTSVFSMPNLTPGSHSVYVEHGANTSGANFSFARLAIDALRVYKGESLSAAPLLWGATGNGGSGTWDIGSTANWNDGGSSTAWHDFGGGDYTAVFTGTGGTVNLASNINANRITFKTSGYTLQGNSLTLNGSAPTLATDANATIASALNGSSGLTKAGTATLSVTGPNNYTGTTTIAGGTLALNGPYATPSFAIASGAVLDIIAATSLDLPAVTFSGTGTLRKSGSADLVWGPTSAIFALGSGSLIDVQAGTFIGGSYANENWAANLSDLNVASGAVFKGVEANVRVNRLTGSGTIGTGYGGAGYQNLSIGVDNGTATFTGSITNTDNNPSWPGNLVKLGSGTQTLAGPNTYTGTTTVNEGKLIITGSLNHTSSVTIATGATLEISGSLAVTGNIINNGTLILTGTPQMSAGGAITNNGTIINLAPGFALPPNLVNNGSILSGPGVSVDYATWASNAGLVGGPDADDDGDGLDHRSEYAFALNPKSGSSANPITIPLKPADGTFTYTRRDPALGTNLAYTIWTSSDLASWTQDASASQAVTATQGEVQSVRVTISPSRLSNSKLFVQVRATEP